MFVLGHAGMGIGHTYPMNSLESILNCLSLGADGTEIDVQMTKDGVLVAYHDETLDSKTNISGRIYNKTWDEIKDARYKNPQYGNYKLVRLEDIFNSIENPSQYIYLFDCKNFQPNKDELYYQTFNSALLDIIDTYDLSVGAYVEFKNEVLVQKMKEIRPEIKQFIYLNFNEAFEIALAYELEGITISIDDVTEEIVAKAHQHGIMISVFNTHTHKSNRKALEYNIDMNQTDRLNYMLKLLK